MADREKVIKGLECCTNGEVCISDCPYFKEMSMTDGRCITVLQADALALLKQEAVEPTINEDGEAYCICVENVGIIPNSKNLPSIRSKYCSSCGRPVKWE